MEAETGSRPGSPDWPTRLSSVAISPAAGSAAAVTAALGVGLLVKLARRTQPEEVPGHGDRLGRLLDARDQFMMIAEDDASAIRDWLSTQGLEEGNPTRDAGVAALTEVPLEAAELCYVVQSVAEPLLKRGHASTIVDGRAGIRLIRASQEIFCTLVEADLGTVANSALVETIEERLGKMKSRRPEKDACQER